MLPRYARLQESKLKLPDDVFPDLWTYGVYLDPLSQRVIVTSEGPHFCSNRQLDLEIAVAALPIKHEALRVEYEAYTGTILVLRILGDVKSTLKYDDTIFYEV